MDFASLNLPEAVLKGIKAVGFTECTAIQEATIPLALKGKDIAGQAQTGTGKTAAFLIVLFTRLLEDHIPPDGSQKHARALIIAPSRELVVQIYKDALALGQYTGLTIAPVFGGIDYQKQAQILQQGVDIIIGTPGRLIDYYNQNLFSLKHIKILVVDEADRMFDMGFIRDIRRIMRKLPPYDQRQSLLFSATLSTRVMELTYEYMNMPEKIVINPEQVTVDRVEQCLYHVGKGERFSLLLGILKTDGCDRTMIFSNTRREAQQITDYLRANNYQAQAITGDLPQKRRLRILESFRQGRLPILVATDVASRGIHIDDVTHVINYCLPQDREDYVHRIGRTARAGAAGKAISIVCEDCALYLENIEEFIKKKIPVLWAEDELFLPYQRPARKKDKSSPKREGKNRNRRSRARKKRAQRPAEAAAAHSGSEQGENISAHKPQTEKPEVSLTVIPGQSASAGEAAVKKKRRRRRRKRSRSDQLQKKLEVDLSKAKAES